MHSSAIRALTRWKQVATSVVVSAAISIVGVCWSIDASADTPHKEFTPDVLVNPNAYYPEGPQLIDEGLLVAEMPRHRIVLIADSGERKLCQGHLA